MTKLDKTWPVTVRDQRSYPDYTNISWHNYDIIAPFWTCIYFLTIGIYNLVRIKSNNGACKLCRVMPTGRLKKTLLFAGINSLIIYIFSTIKTILPSWWIIHFVPWLRIEFHSGFVEAILNAMVELANPWSASLKINALNTKSVFILTCYFIY